MQVPGWNPIICSKSCRRLKTRRLITDIEKTLRYYPSTNIRCIKGTHPCERESQMKKLVPTWSASLHDLDMQTVSSTKSQPTKRKVTGPFILRTHQTRRNFSVAVSELRRDTHTLNSGIFILRVGQVLGRVLHETGSGELLTVIRQVKVSQDAVDIIPRLEQDEFASILLRKHVRRHQKHRWATSVCLSARERDESLSLK